VEVDPTDRVLDVLNAVKWYQDGAVTYRRSCAHGICGSDAMRINGVMKKAILYGTARREIDLQSSPPRCPRV
jgi:succinate dehydrogenase/fumarate reductase-like Fe-S protein